MEIAFPAFEESAEIVVPRVYPDLSTRRVLTMDYVEGVHLHDFLAADPPQEERDRFGALIVKSSFRLSYSHKLLHADPHPGNYFFMPDGRLGLIDFGCCCRYTEEDIDFMSEGERAIEGSEEMLRSALIRAGDLTPRQAADSKRLALMQKWADWVWEPMRYEGAFDFGDPDYFRRGTEAYGELTRGRYFRSLPLNTWLAKTFIGVRALLTRLGARVDFRGLWKQETTVK
jgi:hypothetical protein